MAVKLEAIRSAATRVAASHGLDVVEIEFIGPVKERILRVYLEKNAQNPSGSGFRILDLPHPWIDYLNSTNPVYMVYTNLYPAGQGRPAWDLIATLYAICNVNSNSWFQRVQGSNFVDCVCNGGGWNYFTPGIGLGFKDFYLTIDPTNEAAISTVINRFITAQPPFAAPEIGAGPWITTQPSSQVVSIGDPINFSVTGEGTLRVVIPVASQRHESRGRD